MKLYVYHPRHRVRTNWRWWALLAIVEIGMIFLYLPNLSLVAERASLLIHTAIGL